MLGDVPHKACMHRPGQNAWRNKLEIQFPFKREPLQLNANVLFLISLPPTHQYTHAQRVCETNTGTNRTNDADAILWKCNVFPFAPVPMGTMLMSFAVSECTFVQSAVPENGNVWGHSHRLLHIQSKRTENRCRLAVKHMNPSMLRALFVLMSSVDSTSFLFSWLHTKERSAYEWIIPNSKERHFIHKIQISKSFHREIDFGIFFKKKNSVWSVIDVFHPMQCLTSIGWWCFYVLSTDGEMQRCARAQKKKPAKWYELQYHNEKPLFIWGHFMN